MDITSELDEAEYEVENLIVELEDFIEPEVKHAPPAKLKKLEMTPTQEALNAATMFGAPCYALWYYQEALGKGGQACMPFTLVLLLAAVWLHLPWSVTYHLVCAFRRAKRSALWDPVDNTYRRLDQTWIHISGSLVAYSLSASLVYFGAAAIFNGISVMYLWSKQGRPTRARRRRLTNVVICAVGQLAPLIPRGDVSNAVGAFTSFLVAAGLFVINSKLDGWGHCLFHVLLVPYMAFLCRSAAAADTGSGECDIAS